MLRSINIREIKLYLQPTTNIICFINYKRKKELLELKKISKNYKTTNLKLG